MQTFWFEKLRGGKHAQHFSVRRNVGRLFLFYERRMQGPDRKVMIGKYKVISKAALRGHQKISLKSYHITHPQTSKGRNDIAAHMTCEAFENQRIFAQNS